MEPTDITPKVAKGDPLTLKLETHKNAQAMLKRLRTYYELSWPQIASLPALQTTDEEKQIPVATLAKIEQKGIVPKKHRARFGVGAVDARPRFTVHKKNMASTANSLYNNIDPEDLKHLVALLSERIKTA